MNELNMSAYIQIMQSGLMTHDKQESAGSFLLSAINDQDYVAANGVAALATQLAKGIQPFIPIELMNQTDQTVRPIVEQVGNRPVVEVSPGITEIQETPAIPGGPVEYFSQLRQQ